MSIIKDEIDELKLEYPKIKTLNDEYIFSLICQKYFYKEGNFNYSDYKDSFTDGREDGGIDLITIDQKNGQDFMILVQSKYIPKYSSIS